MRRHQKGSQPSSRSGGVKLPPSSSSSKPIPTLSWVIVLLFSCCISFYAGAWMAWTLSPPKEDCNNVSSSESTPSRVLTNNFPTHNDKASCDCTDVCLNAVLGGQGELAHRLEGKLDAILETKVEQALETKCPKCSSSGGKGGSKSSSSNNNKISHFAKGLITVNRKDLFDTYDFGVPMNSNAEKEDILMLYNTQGSLPADPQTSTAAKLSLAGSSDIPHMGSVLDATANCDQMNVIFVESPERNHQQCMAIVGGQYQGYHIQRWMRLVGEGHKGIVQRSAPLRVTGRMTKASGYDELLYPKTNNLSMHRDVMLKYLTSYDEIRTDLGNVLKKIAIKNTVIVTTVNKGQSELLMNFVCSCRAKGFDLQNLIVFPTDLFSKDLAESMGLATYYAEKLMSLIPQQEAARYGDTTFGLIMMAKVICVHLVSDLGYDMLFQDVDVVWYKDPLEYFHDELNPYSNFDVYFQDDGNRQERFAPYSANSGFYYIRNNERSKLLFRTMMYAGDLIFACRSHQQILITLLAEANSLSGLRVKVLSRDGDDFPSGFHYHMKRDSYMKRFVKGEVHPFIFHMCWTLNKEDKLFFMRQMDMWYVQDSCIGKEASAIGGGASNVMSTCCSAEPLFSCHYRDKASVKSCTDSPPKDKGGRSFW